MPSQLALITWVAEEPGHPVQPIAPPPPGYPSQLPSGTGEAPPTVSQLPGSGPPGTATQLPSNGQPTYPSFLPAPVHPSQLPSDGSIGPNQPVYPSQLPELPSDRHVWTLVWIPGEGFYWSTMEIGRPK